MNIFTIEHKFGCDIHFRLNSETCNKKAIAPNIADIAELITESGKSFELDMTCRGYSENFSPWTCDQRSRRG